MIDAARLREMLDYSADTGEFRWRIKPSRAVDAGDLAGGKRNDGYLSIKCDGTKYQSHRLAWLHVYGDWPRFEIDHIDGNRQNNRIANLRDVSKSVNIQNLKAARRDNISGFLGVAIRRGRFFARIRIDGKPFYLGTYDTPEAAHAAYVAAKEQLHPGFVQ